MYVYQVVLAADNTGEFCGIKLSNIVFFLDEIRGMIPGMLGYSGIPK